VKEQQNEQTQEHKTERGTGFNCLHLVDDGWIAKEADKTPVNA